MWFSLSTHYFLTLAKVANTARPRTRVRHDLEDHAAEDELDRELEAEAEAMQLEEEDGQNMAVENPQLGAVPVNMEVQEVIHQEMGLLFPPFNLRVLPEQVVDNVNGPSPLFLMELLQEQQQQQVSQKLRHDQLDVVIGALQTENADLRVRVGAVEAILGDQGFEIMNLAPNVPQPGHDQHPMELFVRRGLKRFLLDNLILKNPESAEALLVETRRIFWIRNGSFIGFDDEYSRPVPGKESKFLVDLVRSKISDARQEFKTAQIPNLMDMFPGLQYLFTARPWPIDTDDLVNSLPLCNSEGLVNVATALLNAE